MKYQVISAFRDRRTGNQIDPGEAIPDWLDRDEIERLIAARCLRPIEPETPPAGQTPASTLADTNGGAPSLFADGGADEAPATDETAAAAATPGAGGRRGRRASDPGNAQ